MDKLTASYSILDSTKGKRATFVFTFVPGELTAVVGIQILDIKKGVVDLDSELQRYPIRKVLKQVTKLSNSTVLYSPQLHLRGEVEIIKDMTEDEKDMIMASVVCQEL